MPDYWASRVPAFPTWSSKAARHSTFHHPGPHIWTTPASIWSSVAIYTLCTESLTQNTCAHIPFVSPSYLSIFPLPKVEGEKKKRERVEQMASKWLKPPTMAPTTSSSLSFSSHSPSFADYFFFFFFFCLLPSHRLDSAIAASSMPSRLTICAKEAQAHWKPHGANTKSAKRRKRGGRWGKEGGQEGEERWRRAQGLAELF